jgi:uncharacterized protein YggE
MKNAARTLCGLLAISAAGAALPAQQIQIDKNNRTIAVTATDKATADAEVATVHIGFQVFAADSPSAYALGSKTSNTIIDAVKKAGVEPSAIQSEAQKCRAGAAVRDAKPDR